MSISIFNFISKQKEATVSGSNLISICKVMSFLQSNQLTAISVLKTGSWGEGSDTLIPLPFTTEAGRGFICWSDGDVGLRSLMNPTFC